PGSLREVIDILELIPYPIIFPIHPRTLKRLDEFGLKKRIEDIRDLRIVPPQPYIDFLSLMQGSALILSDSGSVQSEASFFSVPCLVCRDNTERPIYLEQGTSCLVGRDKQRVTACMERIGTGEDFRSSGLIKELGRDVALKTANIIVD